MHMKNILKYRHKLKFPIIFCTTLSFNCTNIQTENIQKNHMAHMTNYQINFYSNAAAATCAITIEKPNLLPKPSRIKKSNNITRSANDIFFSQGKSIMMKGRVTDENCVPIAGAIIQIWQQNHYAINQAGIRALDLSDNIPKLQTFDTHFMSSAQTVSNNDGFYTFIVSKPCDNCNMGIDMAVITNDKRSSKNFVNIQTFVKFDSIDKQEKKHKQADDNNAHLIMNDVPYYKFDIILQGKSDYRKY